MAKSMRSEVPEYAVTLGSVTATLVISFLIRPFIAPYFFFLFLAAIMITGGYGGLKQSLLAAALSTLLLKFFFIPPIYSFHVEPRSYLPFGLFIIASIVIGSLNEGRRRAREELRESDIRFKRLVGSNIIGFITADREKIIEGNDAFLKMVGYTREELHSGKLRWQDMTPPEYRGPDNRVLEDLIAYGHCPPFEKEFIRKDGMRVPVLMVCALLDRDPLMWVCFVLDQTGQKRMEAELRSSSLYARSLIEASLDPLMTISPDGKITDVNRATERATGIPRARLIGSVFSNYFVEREKAEEGYRRVLAEGFVRDYPLTMVHISGQITAVLYNAALYRDEEGKVQGIFAAARDITERKRLEQEREQLFREQEARKLAESTNRMKDEFLATLSHELRTPLNAILGWSEMLIKGHLNQAQFSHALETIHRNARAQTQLIDDILDVSRIIAGKIQLDVHRVELLPVVDAAVEVVRPAADSKQIEIERVFDPAVGEVLGDATRLQQVVWNLLSNAVKFTPQKGRVEVRVQRVDSCAEIVVSDTGLGISGEFLPYVFERFRQADSSYIRKHTGLGLGLSIVRHLIELHGGTIEACSPGEGQGSTFTVRIPLAAVRVEAVCPGGPLQNGGGDPGKKGVAVLQGVRILVVDDHRDTRELLGAELGTMGAEVKVSEGARQALETLKTWRPDVFISDIGMPEEDGYTLIRKIRSLGQEEGRDTPAIALTGYAGSKEGGRSLAAGYQMHLAKPTEIEELVRAITALVRKTQGTPDTQP